MISGATKSKNPASQSIAKSKNPAAESVAKSKNPASESVGKIPETFSAGGSSRYNEPSVLRPQAYSNKFGALYQAKYLRSLSPTYSPESRRCTLYLMLDFYVFVVPGLQGGLAQSR